jgi:RND family efflux transporter MFP subunit
MNRWVILPATLLTALFLAGCKGEKPTPPKPTPPTVKVAEATEQTVQDYEYFTGRTEGSQRVDLRARVTGDLIKTNFQDGEIVKKDQVLFEIDPVTYAATQERAKANLNLANAHRDRLAADYTRGKMLIQRNAIGAEEFAKIEGDLKEAEATVGVAKADLKIADQNLAFTKVKAPFAGRISRRMVDPGANIKADETVLSTLVAVEPIYAYFDVDERTLRDKMKKANTVAMAREGLITVDIGFVDEEGYSQKAVLNFVDNKLEPGTGTITMRAKLVDPGPLVTPGMFIRVRFPVGKPYKATMVPEKALGSDQGQRFVIAVDDQNIARRRDVEVGPQVGKLRVIKNRKKIKGVVATGLNPDEKIVVSGLQKARENQAVTPDYKKPK